MINQGLRMLYKILVHQQKDQGIHSVLYDSEQYRLTINFDQLKPF